MDPNTIKAQLSELQKEIETITVKSDNRANFKKGFLSKEGKINTFFQVVTTLPPALRKTMGAQLNKLKALALRKYKASQVNLNPDREFESSVEDLTLPPPALAMGSLHPLTLIQERVIAIVSKMGFEVVEGPEIEDEWHNFTALNFPIEHPARDTEDTFLLKKKQLSEKMMTLRTQTSSVQVRVMEERKPPIKIVAIGRVFRKETISARSHCMFHQIEGLYVDERVTFVDLKEALCYFVKAFFGENVDFRLRPSFFPFTEPSAEVDIACLLCKGGGCAVCKRTGWVEIGGAGIVDPNVLQNCEINPDAYSGFAFGIGLERITMLLQQIPDVRLFTENDVRFLAQFSTQAI